MVYLLDLGEKVEEEQVGEDGKEEVHGVEDGEDQTPVANWQPTKLSQGPWGEITL